MPAVYAFRDLVADLDLMTHDPVAWTFAGPALLPDGAIAAVADTRFATAELIETVSTPARPLEDALNIQWGVADFTAILWVRRNGDFNPSSGFLDYYLMGSQRAASVNDNEIDWCMGAAQAIGSVNIQVGNRLQNVLIPINTWTMMAFTINSSAGSGVATCKFYRDGVLLSTSLAVTRHARTAGASDYMFSIGNDRALVQRTLIVAGGGLQVAHASLFARELSAAELLTLYGVL